MESPYTHSLLPKSMTINPSAKHAHSLPLQQIVSLFLPNSRKISRMRASKHVDTNLLRKKLSFFLKRRNFNTADSNSNSLVPSPSPKRLSRWCERNFMKYSKKIRPIVRVASFLRGLFRTPQHNSTSLVHQRELRVRTRYTRHLMPSPHGMASMPSILVQVTRRCRMHSMREIAACSHSERPISCTEKQRESVSLFQCSG